MADFTAHPPSVVPEVVTLKVPCKGTDEDVLTVTLKNPSTVRLVYKMINTKNDKFTVIKSMGFIEPNSSDNIELTPKPMKNDNGFNRTDHLLFVFGPAPPGDAWEAAEIWKDGSDVAPTTTKDIKVLLTAVKDKKKKKKKKKKKSSKGARKKEENKEEEEEVGEEQDGE